MPFSSDNLLERMYLKRQLVIWRLVAVGVLIFVLVQLAEFNSNVSLVGGDFIARFDVSDVIYEDRKRDELLSDIANNDNIKAVIIYLDTPGGTAVGGEMLYKKIKSIASKKPVVALMRTMCTSAGYMAAMGATKIYAMDSTLTGSVGVILQTAEFTGLANKLGINPITLKSGENKAAPSPVEKLTPAQRKIVQGVIDDFYNVFVDIVAKSRNMTTDEVKRVTDGGRIFTGSQAKRVGLIDDIGGEEEALAWLEKEKKIDISSLNIRDMKVKRSQDDVFSSLVESSGLNFLSKWFNNSKSLDGLLLLWQPNEF